MKRIILACLIISYAFASYGQKIRFVDTSNQWLQLFVGNDGGIIQTRRFQSQYGVDTTIAGKVYHKLDGLSFLTKAGNKDAALAFREDTSTGKLYYRLPDNWHFNVTDTSEHLFFDYNLKVGDTLFTSRPDDTFLHVVQQIDSLQLDGIYHRRWKMQSVSAGSSLVARVGYDFIEGLGTSRGPAFSLSPYIFETGQQLRCFTNKTNQPVCSPAVGLPFCGATNLLFPQMIVPVCFFDNTSSCELKSLGVAGSTSATAIFCPNPANKQTKLSLNTTIAELQLYIINELGQTIVRTTYYSVNSIPIGQHLYAAGIYTYIVQDVITGQRYTGRFVFQ